MLVGVLMLYPVADPVVWFVRINLSIPPPPPQILLIDRGHVSQLHVYTES